MRCVIPSVSTKFAQLSQLLLSGSSGGVSPSTALPPSLSVSPSPSATSTNSEDEREWHSHMMVTYVL